MLSESNQVGSPALAESRRERERRHLALSRDRWFESGPLQRRVHYEPVPPDLSQRRYQPQPVRCVRTPKPTGGQKDLGRASCGCDRHLVEFIGHSAFDTKEFGPTVSGLTRTLRRREWDFNPRALSRGCRLILAQEKGWRLEVDQGGLERRRPLHRGTSGSDPLCSSGESATLLRGSSCRCLGLTRPKAQRRDSGPSCRHS
jgi:hypothetical protein